MSAFFAMGGYAAFVWPAYGVSAVGIGRGDRLALALPMRARRRRLAALEKTHREALLYIVPVLAFVVLAAILFYAICSSRRPRTKFRRR